MTKTQESLECKVRSKHKSKLCIKSLDTFKYYFRWTWEKNLFELIARSAELAPVNSSDVSIQNRVNAADPG